MRHHLKLAVIAKEEEEERKVMKKEKWQPCNFVHVKCVSCCLILGIDLACYYTVAGVHFVNICHIPYRE